MMVSAIIESQFKSGLIMASTCYWVDFSWTSNSLWCNLYLNWTPWDQEGTGGRLLVWYCWPVAAGPRPLLEVLWYLKAKQPLEPPGWCTSSARKWLLFLWICCVPLIFFVYLDECLSWIRTEGVRDVAAEVLYCLLPLKKLSLTEVISFVLQPLYNTHNSLSHME